ncbi:MAG: PilZ domain-containing protein [Lachnospira sp.]|nr:PilZ domain-containing protein [Lachnospira sp.]
MHISELKEGTALTITAELGSEKLEFKTTARFSIDNTLVVDEILSENEEPVSLLSDQVYLTVAAVNERQLPIVWKNVLIKHISFDGIDYHRIAQSDSGKVSNRRGAFRLYLGRSAMFQKGFNKSAIEVILKDVSVSGFSIVTTEELEVGGMQPVHLVCDVDHYQINILGLIVRKQVVENSERFIYGCKILKFDKSLDKFIMHYQREKMKTQKTGSMLRDPDAEETA